jgi:hypothetical protein
LASTLNNPFWDWAVVGLFYSALHYVEGYFRAKKVPLPPKMDHGKRLTLVESIPDLIPISADYRELYNESRDARYDPFITFNQADVTRLRKNLDTVKATITPVL